MSIVNETMWALEMQLHEDWKDSIDDIVVYKNPYGMDYVAVNIRTFKTYIYSPCVLTNEVTWMSRTLEEYEDEK